MSDGPTIAQLGPEELEGGVFVIKICLWPWGKEDKERELTRMTITNDQTGNPMSGAGNMLTTILVTEQRLLPEHIRGGEILNSYYRDRHWETTVRMTGETPHITLMPIRDHFEVTGENHWWYTDNPHAKNRKSGREMAEESIQRMAHGRASCPDVNAVVLAE